MSELFRDYIEDRRRDGVSAAQIKEFERVLSKDLEGEKVVAVSEEGREERLDIMNMKAKDVRPEHVNLLLKPIWDRGARRQAGKVRSFLVAAFNFDFNCSLMLYCFGKTSGFNKSSILVL